MRTSILWFFDEEENDGSREIGQAFVGLASLAVLHCPVAIDSGLVDLDGEFFEQEKHVIGAIFLAVAVVDFLAAVIGLCGLMAVAPNQARVLLLFGEYKGTVGESGFYWVNLSTPKRVCRSGFATLRPVRIEHRRRKMQPKSY